MKVIYELIEHRTVNGETVSEVVLTHEMRSGCQRCPGCDQYYFDRNLEKCPVCGSVMPHTVPPDEPKDIASYRDGWAACYDAMSQQTGAELRDSR